MLRYILYPLRAIRKKDLVRKGLAEVNATSDGRLVRDTERALRSQESQGPDEADGNPVHLLRHPHGERGAAGGRLKRKHAHRKVLPQGN